MDEKVNEIEVDEQAPGVAPGIGLGDILKYYPVLMKIMEIAAAGEGEFDLKVGHVRKHVAITNIT